MLDAESHLLGVLDLTTLATGDRAGAPFLRHALEDVALSVHLALFARAWPACSLIELTEGAPDPLRRSAAVLAVTEDGVVAGMTQPARRRLGHPLAGPLARGIERRLDVSTLANAGVGSTSTSSRWSLRVLRPSRTRRAATSRPLRRPTRAHGSLDLAALAGDDPTLLRQRRSMQRLLDADLPIMLRGETGTGKDAFAHALHAARPRGRGPFVAVNCASLPENLLDSELFGYAPGTFTGGLRQGKPGKIEAAHGGTLFLDEIGDMPTTLQGRLLRVLAAREVTRLGAIDPVPVDIQLITATHVDLESRIAEGRFRADLYYRLRGAEFVLPPLRTRSDLESLIMRLTPPGVSIAPDAMDRLHAYRWPGNIRQLKQVLAFAAACSDDGRILLHDLPPEVLDPNPAPASLRTTRRDSERDALLRALEETGWNVSQAARKLGIGRSTAHRKMRAMGLRRPRD